MAVGVAGVAGELLLERNLCVMEDLFTETDLGDFLGTSTEVYDFVMHGATAPYVYEYGWYKGDAFASWMKKLVYNFSSDSNLTFAGLRALVARDPRRFRDAVYRHSLSKSSFSAEEHEVTSFILLICADRGFRPTVGLFVKYARAMQISLISDWLVWLVAETPDCDPDHLDQYAQDVARHAEIRDRIARRRLAELGDLCIDKDRFEFVIRERNQGGGARVAV